MRDGEARYGVGRGPDWVEYAVECRHGTAQVRLSDTGVVTGAEPDDSLELRALGVLHRRIWGCTCPIPVEDGK